MKVSHISTWDIEGGAAKAAYRIHKGMQFCEMDSNMIVQTKKSNDSSVISYESKIQQGLGILKPTLDTIPLKLYPKRDNVYFSSSILPNNIINQLEKVNPDIINLHWVAGGFIKPKILKEFKKPIIWTMHDMWAFTGGCHYDKNCGRYKEKCGACPILGSDKSSDLSQWNWNIKYNAWKELDFTIVTTSEWLGKCAESSSLFKDKHVKVIPSCIDLTKYKPMDKVISRKLLSLPQDKKLVLFGAVNGTSDERKGFKYLKEALLKLKTDEKEVELVIFGSSDNSIDLGLKAHYIGILHDDVSLALLYNAVDVYVAPSTQENLANTIIESMACGTPCVAFDIGGMPDMIKHKHNGFLASSFYVEDLAKGINWIIHDKDKWKELSNNARLKAEDMFNVKSVIGKYQKLYDEVI